MHLFWATRPWHYFPFFVEETLESLRQAKKVITVHDMRPSSREAFGRS